RELAWLWHGNESVRQAQILYRVNNGLSLDAAYSIPLDNNTRWTSSFTMLQTFLKMAPEISAVPNHLGKVRELTRETKVKILQASNVAGEENLEFYKKIVELAEPVYKLVMAFQKFKRPTVHLVANETRKLRDNLFEEDTDPVNPQLEPEDAELLKAS